MVFVASILILALTRAEIVQRFREPVVTQADGFVRVYANCPADMRREYQLPIARYAADTVQKLYGGLGRKSQAYEHPAIIITIGDVRTNLTEVTAVASTNASEVVTRIRLRAPGHADLERLRLEVIKAFYRTVEKRELSDGEAIAEYRRADPAMRVRDERERLEQWYRGEVALDEEVALKLQRRVFEPGRASDRDVIIFASRLYFYPPRVDQRLLGRFAYLSFREAVKTARDDTVVRYLALSKAHELPAFGCGRSREFTTAAKLYERFLVEFARGEASKESLTTILDDAEAHLNLALEKSQKVRRTE